MKDDFRHIEYDVTYSRRGADCLVCPSVYSRVTLLTTCSASQVIIVLTLVCSCLALPTALPGTERMATAESLQEATHNKVMGDNVPEEDKIDVLIEVLRLPQHSPSVRNYRAVEVAPKETKTFSPEHTTTEETALAEDIIDGKKAVVMVEFVNTPDNSKPIVRKQRSEEQETTTASGVSTATETSDKVTEKPTDPSSDVKREAHSFDYYHSLHDEDKEDDMSVAETIIFRPLFSYRQDTAARRRSFRDVSGIHPAYDDYY